MGYRRVVVAQPFRRLAEVPADDVLEVLQLGAGGQLAVKQQIADL